MSEIDSWKMQLQDIATLQIEWMQRKSEVKKTDDTCKV